MKKRILSIVLVLALCLAYLPAQVHAEPLVYPITDNTSLEEAIDEISYLAAESYTLNVSANGLSYANPIDFGNKVVAINLNGNTLTLDNLSAGGTLTISGGTLNVGNFIWTCNAGSTIALTNNTLNIGGATRINGPCANLTLTLNENSRILIDPANDFLSDDEDNATALQAFLLNYLPDHITVERATVALTFKDTLPNGDNPPLTQVMLKSSFEKADASAVTPQQLPYNGYTQDLFDEGSAAGSVYYSEDGTIWTEVMPEEMNVTDPLWTRMYMVAGDIEHDNSDPVTAQVGITKAGTVTVTAISSTTPVGGAIPTFETPVLDTHYSVTGLVAGDTLATAPTITYQKGGTTYNNSGAIDPAVAGAYEIIIFGATVSDNYTGITFTNGTFKITEGTA